MYVSFYNIAEYILTMTEMPVHIQLLDSDVDHIRFRHGTGDTTDKDMEPSQHKSEGCFGEVEGSDELKQKFHGISRSIALRESALHSVLRYYTSNSRNPQA